MEEIKVKDLKKCFTMSKKEIFDLYETLDVDPTDVMNTILSITEDPGELSKADHMTQLLYITAQAYRQGYAAALYYVNEANKMTIKDLAAQ